jgi:hypothetical protein
MALAMASVGTLSCPGPSRNEANREDVLRVSTYFNLDASSSSKGRNSLLAHLVELIKVPLAEQFIRIERKGNHLVLFRSATSLPSEQLVKVLDLLGQSAVHATAEGVEVIMEDAETAEKVRLEDKALNLGRYEQVEFSQGSRLVLRRRRAGPGPLIIDVRNVAQDEEEWRLFLAREVDLVPFTSPNHLRYLRDVPSVRIVPVRTPASVALYFRVRAPAPTAEVELRRAISLGLGRQTLAQAIDGGMAEAVKMAEDRREAERILRRLGIHAGAPRRLCLYVDESATEFQRVAMLIEQQLAPLGILLDIQALGFEALLKKMKTGDFDIVLHLGGFEKRYWTRLLKGPLKGGFTGYDGPAFEEAVARDDEEATRAILERDLPLAPLYVLHEVVVVDRHFCGVVPLRDTDLSWLADVHHCQPGEEQ